MLDRSLQAIDSQASLFQEELLTNLAEQCQQIDDGMNKLKGGPPVEAVKAQQIANNSHDLQAKINQAKDEVNDFEDLRILYSSLLKIKNEARAILSSQLIEMKKDHQENTLNVIQLDDMKDRFISLPSRSGSMDTSYSMARVAKL